MVTAMRAARLHEIGGTLQIDEIDDPVPADGEVVVDIDYASVNPLDIWITRGAPGVAAANLPWIPGTEGSGHLDGRPVLLRGAGLGVMRHGLYRERAAVPRSAVHDLPEGIDLAQAAGMPVVGITAWHAVHTCAQVTPDDRVLVLGASGGVGSVAVQLAAAAGATVWGQTDQRRQRAGDRRGRRGRGARHRRRRTGRRRLGVRARPSSSILSAATSPTRRSRRWPIAAVSSCTARRPTRR